MLTFNINLYYQNTLDIVSSTEILDAINSSIKAIESKELENNKIFELIGEGNDAKGKVYSLIGTKFCLKISSLSKFVGKSQEKQFEINERGMQAIKGKTVEIEGQIYSLQIIPVVAVAVDENNAYTLMIRHDSTIRLWDEEKIPFIDKDNWDVIRAIKKIIRDFGGEKFIEEMDVNGNNLLVDLRNKVIYLIDPYVPD